MGIWIKYQIIAMVLIIMPLILFRDFVDSESFRFRFVINFILVGLSNNCWSDKSSNFFFNAVFLWLTFMLFFISAQIELFKSNALLTFSHSFRSILCFKTKNLNMDFISFIHVKIIQFFHKNAQITYKTDKIPPIIIELCVIFLNNITSSIVNISWSTLVSQIVK